MAASKDCWVDINVQECKIIHIYIILDIATILDVECRLFMTF